MDKQFTNLIHAFLGVNTLKQFPEISLRVAVPYPRGETEGREVCPGGGRVRFHVSRLSRDK